MLKVRSDEHAAFWLSSRLANPRVLPVAGDFRSRLSGVRVDAKFYLPGARRLASCVLVKASRGMAARMAVGLQIPYRLAALLGRNRQPLGKRFPELFGLVLIVALIGNWVLVVCEKRGGRGGFGFSDYYLLGPHAADRR